MIQAFVSLKPQQPARTESGMRSFFKALQGAVFSQPTIFRTNADVSVRPYSLDAVCEAALNPRCKFVVLRAECEKFWQCTFLLPDKQGMGALYFDLQREHNPRRLAPETLIEMFKRLYVSLSPRLIRIGDSEAREKLKSRHGLVMMPGLGRIEWLQIVSPDVYSDIYNPSDLVASPAFQTEILDDGALLMRVYEDPNNWDSEENISLANFVPGFLAGVAKIKDSEKEKETLRELERLWSRAEKTAEKAYEVLNASESPETLNAAIQDRETQPVQSAQLDELVSSASKLSAEDEQKRAVVFARLRAEFKLDEDNIVKIGTEGPCTIFKAVAEKKAPFYATYQDLDHKVFILNALDDLSRFLSANDCAIKAADFDKIKRLIKTYYRPENQMLDTLEALPDSVARDRRMADIRAEFKPAAVENNDNVQSITFWFYKPEIQGIETLKLSQFEDWPLQIEAQPKCSDMENEPELETDASNVLETQPDNAQPETDIKPETPSQNTPQTTTEASNATHASSAADNIPVTKSDVPAQTSQHSGARIAKIILLIVIILAVLWLAIAYLSQDGNLMFWTWDWNKFM